MKPSTPAIERLERRRQELEQRFGNLRRTLASEIGWVPTKAWVLPVTAFAGGLALAAWLAARRRRD